MTKITTFLMFHGNAEEVINFYVSLFSQSEILEIIRYNANQGDMEGKLMFARVLLHGQELKFIDSPVKHDFTFTPSMSLYVSCDSEKQIDQLFSKLAEGGKVFMPLAAYPFNKKFGWVSDQFGVSWQLSLRE